MSQAKQRDDGLVKVRVRFGVVRVGPHGYTTDHGPDAEVLLEPHEASALIAMGQVVAAAEAEDSPAPAAAASPVAAPPKMPPRSRKR